MESLPCEYFVGNANEVRYNSSHTRTRNIVERAFGAWKRKFPCLSLGIHTKLLTAQAIICATATLYNIGLKYRDFVLEDIPPDNQNYPQIIYDNNNELGLLFRRNFINTHF